MVRWLLACSMMTVAASAHAYVIDSGDIRVEDNSILPGKLLGRWEIQENANTRELRFEKETISQVWSAPHMSAMRLQFYKLKGRQIVSQEKVLFTILELTELKLVTVDRSGEKVEWRRR